MTRRYPVVTSPSDVTYGIFTPGDVMHGKPQAILLISPDSGDQMAHDFGGEGFLAAKKSMMHAEPCPSGEGTPMDPPDPEEIGHALASAGLSTADLAEWLTSVAAIALPEGADLELDVSKDDEPDHPPDNEGNPGPPDKAY